MSEDGSHTGKLSVVQRAALTPSAVLALSLLVIWAVTGAGYFWPMWAWLGIGIATGIWVALRWARLQREATSRRFAAHAGVSVVLAVADVAIWAMSGAGYFWPIYPILGLAGLLALHRTIRRPGQRSLEVRVDELTRTRSGALDVQASELRRIERDLHDGAQARLVALSMKLGRAEDRYADQAEVSALLREAREDASAAIRELRELARGIAPPVLADRGLEAAARSLADRSGMQVEVRASLTRRPTPAVEIAAYFVVAESLTNAAKHAFGALVEVALDEHGGDLFVEVTDFGPGGADESGNGLTGLRQRVEALDGRLQVTSPDGVGTQVEAVLPCGW